MSINYEITKKAQIILRAVNNKVRQKMIKEIIESGEINVTELTVKLRLEQSFVSQQLAILRQAGIVKKERRAKYIYYTVDQAQLFFIEKKAIELCK